MGRTGTLRSGGPSRRASSRWSAMAISGTVLLDDWVNCWMLNGGGGDQAVHAVLMRIAAGHIQDLAVDDLHPDDLARISWSGNPHHIRSVAAALVRVASGEVESLVVLAPDGTPIAKGGIDYRVHPEAGTLWQLEHPEKPWAYASNDATEPIPSPREYRHTLSTIINGLMAQGFTIEHLDEHTQASANRATRQSYGYPKDSNSARCQPHPRPRMNRP